MKTFGRRLFSKATMGAPLMIAKSEATIPASIATNLIGMPAHAEDVAVERRRNDLYRSVAKATKKMDLDSGLSWRRRQMMGGFDPDIAVLNSMSHARRVLMQTDRDTAKENAKNSVMRRVARSFGFDPDEFGW